MTRRSEIERRLDSLTPGQRRLLELRLRSEQSGDARPAVAGPEPTGTPGADHADDAPEPMRFSFFFFSADESGSARDAYSLVLECARFADRHGFEAVWTPERHFVDFGGAYPNPSVLGAALATVTTHVQIRAGSVVLPLHHPIRVAEEWSVVDNLSGGRAAISCASGWHPEDFVIAPTAYEERKAAMEAAIHQIRRLWAGEEIAFPGVDGTEVAVRLRPRPVQPRLPMWITTSGNLETWEKAGELDAHVLGALGKQTIAELEDKIRRYRAARARHGHEPGAGTVSLMLHTYLGADLEETRARIRAPLAEYLRTHMTQRDRYVTFERITDTDKEALADLAVEHYMQRASLIGTPETCSRFVNRLAQAGVDEIACLLDFGLDARRVLEGLEPLTALRDIHAGVEARA